MQFACNVVRTFQGLNHQSNTPAEKIVEETVENIVEEVKEELSAVEEVQKVTHNPEAETKKAFNLYAQKQPASTMDRVLQRISNINK